MRPNLFTLLHIIAIIFSGMIGAESGFKWYGLPGKVKVIGALVGGALGLLMGCLASTITNRGTERWYRRKTTASLRDVLYEPGIDSTDISSLVISILLERGEPAESLRVYVFSQLHSGDVCQRKAGIFNLALCFPVIAAQLEGFDPFHPSKEHLERLKDIQALTHGEE